MAIQQNNEDRDFDLFMYLFIYFYCSRGFSLLFFYHRFHQQDSSIGAIVMAILTGVMESPVESGFIQIC